MKSKWIKVKSTKSGYKDIIYEKMDGIAKITINRPEKRNAFRPETVFEMYDAFSDAREDQTIGVILLTGYGPAKDGKYAFCSGGDQSIRGDMVHALGWVNEHGFAVAAAGCALCKLNRIAHGVDANFFAGFAFLVVNVLLRFF